MDEDVALANHREHRPVRIAQLRRNRRREWRVAQIRDVERGDRHEITEVEERPGVLHVVLGQRGQLRRLLIAQLFEQQ